MEREKHCALSSASLAISSLRDAIRACIGPLGLDVLVKDEVGTSLITNSGTSVLRALPVHHGIARLCLDATLRHVARHGDGGSSLLIAIAEGVRLVDRGTSGPHERRWTVQALQRALHDVIPSLLDSFFRDASVTISLSKERHTAPCGDPVLQALVLTSLAGKFGPTTPIHLTNLLVDIVQRAWTARQATLEDAIRGLLQRPPWTILPGGSVTSSRVVAGVVLEASLPAALTARLQAESLCNGKVLALDAGLDDSDVVFGAGTRASIAAATPEVARATLAEGQRSVARRLTLLRARGVRVVVSTAPESELVAGMGAEAGVLVLPGVQPHDLERVASETGAGVCASNQLTDLAEATLGTGGTVRFLRLGGRLGVHLSGPASSEFSVLLQAPTQALGRQWVAGMVRSLRVLSSACDAGTADAVRVVPGAAAMHALAADALEQAATGGAVAREGGLPAKASGFDHNRPTSPCHERSSSPFAHDPTMSQALRWAARALRAVPSALHASAVASLPAKSLPVRLVEGKLVHTGADVAPQGPASLIGHPSCCACPYVRPRSMVVPALSPNASCACAALEIERCRHEPGCSAQRDTRGGCEGASTATDAHREGRFDFKGLLADPMAWGVVEPASAVRAQLEAALSVAVQACRVDAVLPARARPGMRLGPDYAPRVRRGGGHRDPEDRDSSESD